MAPELVFLELGAIPGSLAESFHSSVPWQFHPIDTQKGLREKGLRAVCTPITGELSRRDRRLPRTGFGA